MKAFIFLAILIVVIYAVAKRKRNRVEPTSRTFRPPRSSESNGEKAPPKRPRKTQSFNSYFRDELTKSGYFSTKGIAWILKTYDKTGTVKRIATEGIPMTAGEKRAAGIRANTKISKDYFSTLKNIPSDEKPKCLLEYCYFQAFHRESRAKDLQKLRSGKIVKRVKIMNCGDERDCHASKKMQGKSFEIDSVPELPLEDCDAKYCRCSYQAEIDLDEILGDG